MPNDEMYVPKPLTREERELAREFLNTFSQPGFQPYAADTASMRGGLPYAESMEKFIAILQKEKIGVRAAAIDSSVNLYRNPGLILNAPATDLRRLLYAMADGGRFSEDVFGEGIRKGIITAALFRILEVG